MTLTFPALVFLLFSFISQVLGFYGGGGCGGGGGLGQLLGLGYSGGYGGYGGYGGGYGRCATDGIFYHYTCCAYNPYECCFELETWFIVFLVIFGFVLFCCVCACLAGCVWAARRRRDPGAMSALPLLLLISFVSFVSTQGNSCPPGLSAVFSSSNQPQTCSPQATCQCQSVQGAICQYSSFYSNYICCSAFANQCGSNVSPQMTSSGQLVQCSTNSQCASNFVCTQGVCCASSSSSNCQSTPSTCLSGQIQVNGQCYNSVQIGASCQRSEQCVGGSVCTQNICQCPQGYLSSNQQCVVNNGVNCPLGTVSYGSQCVSLASPGQTCMTSSQCIDNSQCNNGVCTCLSNYNMVYGYCIAYTGGPCQSTQTLVNNQCMLYAIVGESCVASNQCVGGSTCSNGVCRCNPGFTAMYGYCIGGSSSNQCPNGQVLINNQCWNTAQIGTQCSYSQQCLGNSQCSNGLCQCPPGSSFPNGQCSGGSSSNGCASNQVFIGQCSNGAQIGSQCSQSQQCLGNSQCINNQCQCPSGAVNSNGRCVATSAGCPQNQVMVNNQCWNTAQIGFQCSFSQQCFNNGGQCTNGVCQCPAGTSNLNGQCATSSGSGCGQNQVLIGQCWNTVQIGQQCSYSQQCLGNSQCSNGLCQCPSGSSNVNGYCQGASSCTSNQVLINNQCWTSSPIGGACTYTQQCLGNSQCLNSVCQCGAASSNVNGFCSGSGSSCPNNQVLVNNQCLNTVQVNGQCSFSQQCLSGSTCQAGVCRCPNNSQLVNGVCSGTTTNGVCPANFTAQTNQQGQLVNCMQTTCAASAICQYSATAQQYVCCMPSNNG
ncbi:unnamed protein product [Caenorhabditis auriculariae]|uniref:EGF-like domain-containing protein n=1 Tax=Caenorhabditis auriculariae TaxID=2777116 RepID=A0A8S1HPZ6_9PELO|nr:unnamed protein product [Caenorhabditis auriculariae]